MSSGGQSPGLPSILTNRRLEGVCVIGSRQFLHRTFSLEGFLRVAVLKCGVSTKANGNSWKRQTGVKIKRGQELLRPGSTSRRSPPLYNYVSLFFSEGQVRQKQEIHDKGSVNNRLNMNLVSTPFLKIKN